MLLRSLFACFVASTWLIDRATSAEPDFSRDIRPILSDHCFACHGPDAEERKAGLRLDMAEGVAEVVDVDDVGASEIVLRITSNDPGSVMPPPDSHKPLSDEQKANLQKWIAGGAEFQSHWAFVAPHVPGPSVEESQEPIASTALPDQVDAFIDQAAIDAGLQPNPPADRRALLRRVCLDLTGLPPTRQQIEAFVNDHTPDAYSNLIDRLLQSPAFGQHVGRYWLDLVRYGDTHGLHLDNYREMWPYRDWVIDAFNANMPFDQFITHQLAGDLLPDATDKERIASGFNRLNVTTSEGGSIYDEVFARNCMDRTDAFGTIFMGLTTGCAVCHDHKFDPISQRDYYSLLAYFNSLDGRALDNNVKDPPPVLSVPSEDQSTKLKQFEQTLASIALEKSGPIPTVDAAQRAWEQSLGSHAPPRNKTLHPSKVTTESGTEMKVRKDGSIELVGAAATKETTTIVFPIESDVQWQTLRLEALVDKPDGRVGASDNGNAVLSEIVVELKDALSPDDWTPIPVNYAFADIEQDGEEFAISNAIDGKVDDATGWAVAGHQQSGGRTAWLVTPSLVAEGPDAQLRVKLKYQSKYASHQFRHVRLSLSDSPPSVPDDQAILIGDVHTTGPFPVENAQAGYSRTFASQKKAFQADEIFRHEDRDYRWQHRGDIRAVEVVDLPTVEDRNTAVVIHQSIVSPSAQKVTLLIGTDDGHIVVLGKKEVGRQKGPSELRPLNREYELDLKKGSNDLYITAVNHGGRSQLTFAYRSPAIRVPSRLGELVQQPPSQRSEEVQRSLREYYRKVCCLHPDWLALVDEESGTRIAMEELQSEIPTTLIWKELDTPRQAHLLKRGQYDQPGEAVPRGTPEFLPPLPEQAPNDRLGLAMWLTSPDHPLTARVAVNRFWQQVFGTGLVKTSEDFGSQGEPPSHPKLLDWLAVDFQTNGWDVKRLMKSLVMTQAYQRSAKVTDAMLKIDPNNRLLARGPRHRLDAEVLRDQSLALAGLLVNKQGGPSVKPPQPDGLWAAVGYSGSNTVRFTADAGDKIFRRSVYTFWKRTSAPPQMSTLDAPSRESCTARRERTNTPLQALLLMNETQYLQAAKALAKRMSDESSASSDTEQIAWLFETVTARLPTKIEQSELQTLFSEMTVYYDANPQLAVKLVGSSDARAAAGTILASTLLNLDETVNK